MSEPPESMTAFVTSDVLDPEILHIFLAAKRNGGNVRWRGLCWEIQQHQELDGGNGEHSFRLVSVPKRHCG